MNEPIDSESTRRQVIDALIGDVRIARQAGKHVDDRALIEMHPDLLPELAAELEKLARIERARQAASIPAEASAGFSEAMNSPTALLADLVKPNVQIPGYSLLREISRGGQAAVYLALQLSTGRRVAIKVMHEGPYASERAITRFRREVQALAALNHPNIVAIVDTGRTPDGSRFIVMNYIPGMSLSDYMKDRYAKDATDPGKLLRLFLKICDAVNAAHRLGIIHRDLKPSNIRVDERGEPHILDFGLARTALDHALAGPEHVVSVTGEFLGSLPWSSPEQAEGDPDKIDVRTDVYSLGVILYQILTAGRFPYEVVGNIRDVLNNILTADPMPPSKIVPTIRIDKKHNVIPKHSLPSVNEAIEKIVLKALAKKREQRYQSAGDLGRDVARYLAGQRTTALRHEAPATVLPKRRMGLYLGIGCVCVAAVAAVAVFRQARPHPEPVRSALVAPGNPSAPEAVIPTKVREAVALPAVIAPAQNNTVYSPPPPAPQTISVRGTLAVLFKGGTLEAFLNGRRIHQSDGDDLRSIPLALSPGDCIVLRMSSSFYYRSVRCAFIADDRADSFPVTAGGVVLQPAADPKSAPPVERPQSPHPATGAHDERQQIVWNDASLPATADWIALPQPNITYDLVFTAPPPHSK